MIQIGRGIRWYKNYLEEVAFCVQHGFHFMQLWFKDGEICLDNIPTPKEKYIKDIGFPIILHAVFDPQDFDLYGDQLLELVQYFGHKEVIIHPVCEKQPVFEGIDEVLRDKVYDFSLKAKSLGITFYLENNSVVDTFHYKPEALHRVHDGNDHVELLLDVAHIDNYAHLEKLIAVKYPKCLHVAGKHFNVPHEHLPLTRGDIDYTKVFTTYLPHFQGKIILEVDGVDEEIIASKKIIDEALFQAHLNF